MSFTSATGETAPPPATTHATPCSHAGKRWRECVRNRLLSSPASSHGGWDEYDSRLAPMSDRPAASPRDEDVSEALARLRQHVEASAFLGWAGLQLV